MEPQIQYCTTIDGVSIAYWTVGRGPVLLYTPASIISPTIRSWQTPEGRRWYEGLSDGRTVVRYDSRGCGNSQSDAIASSLETQVNDLEAVVDAVGADQVSLFGYLFSGPAAITYGSSGNYGTMHV